MKAAWPIVLAAWLTAVSVPATAQSQKDLLAGAKTEQKLLLYSTGDARSWDATLKAFEAKHPDIKVEILELGGNELWERFRAESASGVRTGDIAVGGSPHRFVEASDRGELMDYKPAGIEKLPTFPDAVPGVTVIAVDPQVILFNKAILPQKLWPTGIADLAEKAAANPEIFKGKISTFDPVSSSVGPGYNLAIYSVMGDEKYWASMKKLLPSLRYESGGAAMLEKVTSGEHVAAFFVGRNLTVSRITGARERIVGWTYHDDGEPLQLRSMAIMGNAKSPNAAKLLASFLVSEEGQAAYGTSGSSPVHPDVPAAANTVPYSKLLEQIGGTKNAGYYGFSRAIFDYQKTFAPKINQIIGR
ncbi:MAG TPA: extracellular solute-binding protein [Xanthobacteraceae bacterium]|nr:extracellular solute-binding protein [Xanthobacteraceae bacterium]